ncbi:MAG: respiratory nitrate reductase subunit gamma [Bacteroidota bacterium]|nr:respiratory nitrate reductase subunit gamma [Bacteroidota bacterium]
MKGLIPFIVLPYVALVSVLAGSLYRYFFRGFKVSSLSSQLLESRRLFFGSRPFHWGIIFLFFGHLTAFLIPRTVLAWDGVPLRLHVLEITAFSFGIIALAGLAILILRRIQVKRVRAVTTWMDVLVFAILTLQVLSGLITALFYRWGSTWFTEILTPYLRSVFYFKPDVNAVVALPVLIKIHIISAFILIGMIPYTRFIHFLVYPFDYLWRRYQVVIWNRRGFKKN